MFAKEICPLQPTLHLLPPAKRPLCQLVILGTLCASTALMLLHGRFPAVTLFFPLPVSSSPLRHPNQAESGKLEKEIRKQFEQLHEFLQSEEKTMLEELREEARKKQGLIEDKIKKLSEESRILLQEVSQLQADLKEDDISFLKVRLVSRCANPKPNRKNRQLLGCERAEA